MSNMKNLSFSQRMGITPINKQLQLNNMDDDLRNSLWNLIFKHILNKLKFYIDDAFSKYICLNLWNDFFKKPIDEIPKTNYNVVQEIKYFFYSSKWYLIYDMLEFFINLDNYPHVFSINYYISDCNYILERENSAYRFINKRIVPISNEIEINEIEEALKITKNYTALKGANMHLSNALDKLSNRTNPDYRNSIKESISAVESLAKVIANDENATLGSALKELKKKNIFHKAFLDGLEKLYGYTSDANGIRHALLDEPNLDLDDARFMLVTCSAFINYIVSKANKLGITFS